MPSPFPGMDPYLEGSLWTTFHFAFGAELVRQLAPQLLPRYLALPVERLVFDETNDVAITISSFYPSAESHTAPLQLATVIPETVPHVSIEIRDTANHQLVTAIEILSPTNKRGDGRLEYLTKRRRILMSTAHLLEIDFLRQGQRVPMQQQLPDAHYFVFLSRADRRPILDVWPILIHETLPIVPIPLLKDDPDVLVDLQKTFTATYDLLGYDLLINYAQSADIPGDTPTQESINQILQSQGLRDND